MSLAVVPFSVAGAAANQQLEERLLQVGPYSLLLKQRPKESGNTAHLRGTASGAREAPTAADLSRVGLVLWLSGYVLADFLLMRINAEGDTSAGSSSTWTGVRVLELGCGAGTVGMFLALAGAQVVLTDQQHILPLTGENLRANFTAAQGLRQHLSAGSTSGSTPGSATKPDPDLQVVADDPHEQGASAPVTSAQGRGPQRDLGLPGTLAVGAFTAAFGCDQDRRGSGTTPTAGLQPQHWVMQQSEGLVSRVFAAGPLVLQHTWGESLQRLRDDLAAAAAVRLRDLHTPASAMACTGQMDLSATAVSSTGCQQQQQQQRACCACEHGCQGMTAMSQWGVDVVVGADLLYDPGSHAALLTTLNQLATASPHVQVFMSWRDRHLGEDGFFTSAGAAGWVIKAVPAAMMHPEFNDGFYKLVQMVKLP